jgi:ubiquinone/menaquinone biosynthesis C-methylase UbiE
VAVARRSLPADLAGRVSYRVASAQELEIERAAFDLVVFSWSL